MDRPNRFVVRVNIGGRIEQAHCPNPGRLSELLFPGDPVVLERAKTGRKLGYTLVAVERETPNGAVTIPLVSVRANAAVGALVLPRLFPGAQAKPEVTLGSSRFDWAVDEAGLRHLIEVKACSEVEDGTALFPDAPSLRARKHLEDLAAWADQGYRAHVVFAVVHGKPRSWAPNHHTDPAFARTLGALAPKLNLHAVVFKTDPDGSTRLVEPHLEVDLTRAVGPDSGHLICLEPGPSGWSVRVEWYPKDWEKAVARAPARRSFAIRSPYDQRATLKDDLAGWVGDPRTDRRFIATVMRWRHTETDAEEPLGP